MSDIGQLPTLIKNPDYASTPAGLVEQENIDEGKTSLPELVPRVYTNQEKLASFTEALRDLGGDTSENIAKAATAFHLSERLNRPVQDVLQDIDKATKDYFGDLRPPRDALAAILDQAKIEAGGVKLGQLGYKIAQAKTPEEFETLWNQYQELKSSLPDADQVERSMPTEFAKGTVGLIAQMVQRIPETLLEGSTLATGLSAGALSSLAGGPIRGAATAYQVMQAVSMGKEEYGNSFVDMIDSGIPFDVARAASYGPGVINALLETAQYSIIFRGIPGVPELLGKVSKTFLADSWLSGGFKNKALRFIAAKGIDIGGETLTELAQESTSITFDALAKYFSNEARGTDIPLPTIEEVKTRIAEIAKSSLYGFTGLTGIGAVTKGVYKAARTTGKKGTETQKVTPGTTQAEAEKQEVSPTSRNAIMIEEELTSAIKALDMNPNDLELTERAVSLADELDATEGTEGIEITLEPRPIQAGESWLDAARLKEGMAATEDLSWTPAETLRNKVVQYFRGVNEENVNAISSFVDLVAKNNGEDSDTFLSRVFTPEIVTTGEADEKLAQGIARGGTIFVNEQGEKVSPTDWLNLKTARATILAGPNGDVSTFFHEFTHAVVGVGLNDNQRSTLETAFKKPLDQFTIADLEDVATKAEEYFRTGEAPTVELRGLYEQIRDMITRFIARLQGQMQISPELKAFYDSLVSSRPIESAETIIYQPAAPAAEVAAIRAQYEDTEAWMKAPNGEPTKLNELQWLQVRTPAFKAWFGDWEKAQDKASKVIDELGEPLMVFHGTTHSFKDFSLENLGTKTDATSAKKGFFFAEDPRAANSYAIITKGELIPNKYKDMSSPFESYKNNTPKQYLDKAEEISKIIDKERKAFINEVENAVYYTSPKNPGQEDYLRDKAIDRGKAADVISKYDPEIAELIRSGKNIREILKTKLGINVGLSNEVNYLSSLANEIGTLVGNYKASSKIHEGAQIVPAFLSLKNPNIIDIKGREDPDVFKTINRAINIALKNGQDGVIIKNISDGGPLTNHYVVFSPTQIKSAIGNVGTFNPNNPSILYQDRLTEYKTDEWEKKANPEWSFSRTAYYSNKDILDNAHKLERLDFTYFMEGAPSARNAFKFYKSPVRFGTPSSEYRIGVVKGEAAYIRTSNHWGPFYSKDELREWELLGAPKKKDGGYRNVVQSGYIPLRTILEKVGSSQPRALYQPEDSALVRRYVESGQWVPDDVLSTFAGETWADEEIKARNDLRNEADEFSDPKEWIQYNIAFSFDNTPEQIAYLKQIYDTRDEAAAEPQMTRAEQNLKFIDSLDKTGLEALLSQLIGQNIEDLGAVIQSFDHGLFTSAIKKVSTGGKLTDVHYKKLMDQIKYNPTAFREKVYSLLGAQDEYKAFLDEVIGDTAFDELDRRKAELSKLSKEIDKKTTSIERLTQEIERERFYSKNIETKLAAMEDAIQSAQAESGADVRLVKETYRNALSEARKEARLQTVTVKREAENKIREKQKTRAKMMKWVKAIMAPPSASMHWENQKALKDLQAGYGINLGRRGEEVRKQLLERVDPATRIELTKELEKRNVKKMTYEELEQLSMLVAAVRREGIDRRKLDLLESRIEFNRVKEEILSTLEPFMKGEIAGKMSKEGLKQARSTLWKSVELKTLTPERVAELLDGGKKDGVFTQILIDDANRATDKEIIEENRRNGEVKRLLKKYKLGIWKLGETISLEGITYTRQDVMGLYLQMKNPDSQKALLPGGGENLTEMQINSFIMQLTEDEKRFSDELAVIVGNSDDFKRIENSVGENRNELVEKVRNYFPMLRRSREGATAIETQIQEDLLERTGKGRPSVKFGARISRMDIAEKNQRPIRHDAMNIALNAITAQERYIAMQPLIKKLSRLINDPEIQNSLISAYGSSAKNWIVKYTNDLSNPNLTAANDGMHHVSRFIRSNTAVAYLSFNAMTVLKQLPAIALYLGDAGPLHLMKAAGEFITNPRGLIAEVKGLDPQVMNRSMDQVLEELKLADRNAYERIIKTIGTIGMAPIQIVDTLTVIVGWKAVYNRELQLHGDPEKAMRKAQTVTMRTQQSSRVQNLPEIYRTNEGMNWILMFTNQLSKMFNMIIWDVPQAVKEREIMKAAGYITALSLSAVAMGVIARKAIPDPTEPEDQEKLAKDILFQTLSCIPVVGNDIVSGIEGYSRRGVEILPAFGQLGATARAWFDSEKDIDDKLDASRRLLLEGMVLTGLPQIGTKRMFKTFVDDVGELQFDPWELIGGAPKE